MFKKAENRLVLTFYTTAGAMAVEKLCKQNNIEGRLFPVPRSITSDCGIAWSMKPEDKETLLSLLNDEKEISGYYEMML